MLDWIDTSWSIPLVTALCHSLWHGLLIMTIIHVVTKLGLFKNARQLFLLHFGGLLLLSGLFILTFLTSIRPEVHLDVQSIQSTELISISNVSSISGISFWAVESIIALVWLCGVIILLVRYCLGAYSIFRISYTTLPCQPFLNQKLLELKEKIDIRTSVFLRVSKATCVPLVIGVIRPTIIIPLSIVNQLSTDEIESILIHELTHIKYNDFAIKLFQHLVESFLFFNPAIWWISLQMNRYREYACDDVVNQHMHYPDTYIKALYKVAQNAQQSSILSPALINNKSELIMRVKRMLNQSSHFSIYKPIILLLGMSLMVFMFVSFQSIQEQPEKKQEKEKKEIIESNDSKPVSPVLDKVLNQPQKVTTSTTPVLNNIEVDLLADGPDVEAYLAPSLTIDPQVIEESDVMLSTAIDVSPVTVLADKVNTSKTVDLVLANPEIRTIDLMPALSNSRVSASTSYYTVVFSDTLPTNDRIEALEELLEEKTEELEELTELLTERIEEQIEYDIERMEDLSEQLEDIIEPRLEALEDKVSEDDLDRLEDLTDELEDRMDDYIDDLEESIDEEVIEVLEERMEELTEELEETMEEGDSKERKEAIENLHVEIQEVARQMEHEMQAVVHAHQSALKDPEILELNKEIEQLSQNMHKNHKVHEEVWTEEAKAVQEEMMLIQKEIQIKINGMTDDLSSQINVKAREIEEIARKIEVERNKLMKE